jgi:hypothetical protein
VDDSLVMEADIWGNPILCKGIIMIICGLLALWYQLLPVTSNRKWILPAPCKVTTLLP